MWNPMAQGSMDNFHRISLYKGSTNGLKKWNRNPYGKTPLNYSSRPVLTWFPGNSLPTTCTPSHGDLHA